MSQSDPSVERGFSIPAAISMHPSKYINIEDTSKYINIEDASPHAGDFVAANRYMQC